MQSNVRTARRAALMSVATLALTATAVAQTAPSVAINVVSSRSDLVTGGDARVEIKANGVRADQLHIWINGREEAKGLSYDAGANTLSGVVSGFNDGPNFIQALAPTGQSVTQGLVNYPITGPVLSGPHLSPYECRTKESGLGDALDANCSVATRYDWYYLPASVDRARGVAATAWKKLENPKAKPADAANITTIDGRTVPYIVRVESGTINRSIYRIAVLDDPTTEAVGRADGWNGRLGVTFGGGCGTQYNQGTNQATSVLSDLYLARGFAFMNSTEMVNQLHCNQVLQGETFMMLKEHFVEAYGRPRWTVGTGGSGGSIQQLVITQMMPGLLDGLQPSLSFPDSSMNTADCGLLQNFWKSTAGKKWSQDKKTAVEGYTAGTCAAWERSFVPTIQAANTRGCGIEASLVYDPKKNPKGARCTVQEMRVNIYGRDPATGYARRPIDNVGVQYGLTAVNEGKISVADFLQLNEKIGGNDPDGGFGPKRTTGDPAAIRAIYASGLFNTFAGLNTVPILHYRTYNDAAGDIHDRHRDLTIRARLEKATGSSANQVIWVGPGRAPRAAAAATPAAGGAATAAAATGTAAAESASVGGVNLAAEALTVMTRWLDNMAADTAPLSPEKVVRHKPADAVDAYFAQGGKRTNEVASWDNSTSWNKMYPVHLEPRLAAGAPVANDIVKCQLKPVDFKEYKVKFTSAQQSQLKKIFPDGVCDWSKPSVGYASIRGTYQKYGQ